MTDDHTDFRFLFGGIALLGVDPLAAQLTASGVEQLTDQSIGAAGGNHRLGDIHRPLEGAADKHAFAAGQDRVVRGRFAEAVLVEFDIEGLRESLDIFRWVETNREHNQIEFLFLNSVVEGRVANCDVPGNRVLFADGDIAADKTHVIKLLGALVETLKILAVGADVVMEDGGVEAGVVVFGQDHLLLGVGTADRRAVAVAAFNNLPRADALNPGDSLSDGPGQKGDAPHPRRGRSSRGCAQNRGW